jgi:hypothetical protein
MKNNVVVTATLAMVLGSLACADTYVVDPTGGGDYLTVARAAQWAPEGSTVLVAAGRYEGRVRIEGRNSLTIQAMEGAQVTLVPGPDDQGDSVVSIMHSEGVTLRGMSVKEAVNGGVWIFHSSAVVEDCAVRGSSVSGVRIHGHCELVQMNNCEIGPNPSTGIEIGNNASGQIHVSGSRIHDNSSLNQGGGIHAGGGFDHCELHLVDTEIHDNSAIHGGGLHLGQHVNFVTIKDCVLRDNEATNGAGFYVNQPSYGQGVKIDDTLISGNAAQSVGGGMLVEVTHHGTIKMTSCHVVENTAGWMGAGAAVRWCNDGLNFQVKNCEFLNNIAEEGGGGLNAEAITPAQVRDSHFCGNLPEPLAGDWEGAGNVIVDTCQAGACCIGSDCMQMSYAKCEDAGGRWGGVGIDCDKISCNGPIEGACCLGTYCVTLMPEDCELHEGVFLGSGILCVDSRTYCPKYSKADFDRNNKVDINDLMKFFDYWGN